jgi:hypothetical protein
MITTSLIDCKGLPPGSCVEVETKNRHYQIECLGGNAVRICGHPDYCPTPVNCYMMEAGIIEQGQRLQFLLDDQRPVTTSRIVKVRVSRAA